MGPLGLERIRKHHARAAAGGLALLALLGQLGSVAHLAFVKHVSCSEHGELVEVADVQAPRPAAARDTAAVEADALLTHGHDHCSIATFRRERLCAPVTIAAAAPVADDSPLVPAAARRAPPPAIPLLDLAPKNSPPA